MTFLKQLLAYACLASLAIGMAEAQWIQANGPYGVPVNAFVVTGTIVTAATDHGVWRSVDNGVSWSLVGLETEQVLSLSVAAGTLWAGTAKDLYRSNDNGVTWTSIQTGRSGEQYTAICVSGTAVFVGTRRSGLIVSSDGGSSWTEIMLNTEGRNITSLAVVGMRVFAVVRDSTGRVYTAAGLSKLWQISDGGVTVMDVATLMVKDSVLYAGCTDGSVYRGGSAGNAWTALTKLPLAVEVSALAGTGTTLYAGTMGKGVYRSDDNGVRWTGASMSLADSTVLALAIVGGTEFAGTYSGVFRSLNKGAAWSASNTGLMPKAVTCLAASTDAIFIFAGTKDAGIYRSTNTGTGWELANNGLRLEDGRPCRVRALAVAGNVVFAATNGTAVVYQSTDNGTTWRPAAKGLPSETVSKLFTSGKVLFAGFYGGGVYRKAAADSVWTKTDAGLPSSTITAFTADTVYLYAAAGNKGVYRSADDGATWQSASAGLPSGASLTSLTVSSSGTTRYVVLGTSANGIYRSADNGMTWTLDDAVTTAQSSVAAVVSTANGLFAATPQAGVYYAPSLATSWRAFNPGLTETMVNDVVFNQSKGVIAASLAAGTLYAGTEHGGVFKYPMTGALIASLSIVAPARVAVGKPFTVEVRAGEPSAVKSLYGISFKLKSSAAACTYVEYSAAPGNFWGAAPLSVLHRAGGQAVDIGISKTTKQGTDGSGTVARAMFMAKAAGVVQFTFEDLVVMEEHGTLIPVDTTLATVVATVPPATLKPLPAPPYTAGKPVTVEVHVGDPDVKDLHDLTFSLQSSKASCTYVNGSAAMEGILASYATASFTSPDAQTVTMRLASSVAAGVTGTGFVAKAQFVCPSSGDVNFTLTGVTAKNTSGAALPLTTSSAAITVTSSTKPPVLGLKVPPTLASVPINMPAAFSVNVSDPNGLPLTYIWKVDGVVKQLGDSVFAWMPPEAGLLGKAAEDEFALRKTAAAPTITCVYRDQGGLQDSTQWNVRLTSVPAASSAPRLFALAQNYPNPFNPATTIAFDLADQAMTTLTVYDVLGHRITELVHGTLAAGRHSVTFNAAGLASGVYLYRLQSGAASAVRRLAVVK